MEFFTGVVGLVTAIISLIAAVLLILPPTKEWWWRRTEGKGPKEEVSTKKRRDQWKILLSVPLFLLTAVILIIRFTNPEPSVSITSPLDSMDVSAEENSVWFPVRGSSSNVYKGNSLKIYVLVHSGTEWHVQRRASIASDGQWTLERAWIGDATAPINPNSQIKIMAVVSQQQRGQDEKVQDPGELDPLAMSPEIIVTVLNLR